MNLSDLLLGIFVYLAAAVIAAPLAMRLGLGSVLGYLVAGVMIGPAVLNITGQENQEVMHFAEFGVIVMLFLVGLELRPSMLWNLRKPILGLGGMQVLATAGCIMLVALALGIIWQAALSIGLILAMSSTALVMQSLNERGELKTASGKATFSVLLFQDISVIPILTLLPLLALSPATSTTQSSHSAQTSQAANHDSLISSLAAWEQTLLALFAIGVIILAGRYLLPPLFRFIAKSGLHESFIALALLIVIGITLLMQLVGVSPALGTFLAGVILADNEYRHEIEIDLEPFKGLLLAVFFLAVGAGIDFNLVLGDPVKILSYLLIYTGVKLTVLYAISRFFGLTTQDSVNFAFNLAQGGEFAFVLISFCSGLALLNTTQASTLVAIVALSMALSPILMILNKKWIEPKLGQTKINRADDDISEEAPVIIAGYGRFGMTVGRILQSQKISAVVLDQDAEQIEALKRFGYRVYYGDATRPDLLQSAGAAHAKILIIAIDDREKIMQIVETARKHFPHLRIFARAYDRFHAYDLLNVGVEDIYRELFDSSVAMGRDVLSALGIPRFEAYRLAKAFTKHDEENLRQAAPHAEDDEQLMDTIKRGRAQLTRLMESDRLSTPLTAEAWNDKTNATQTPDPS